MDSKISNKKVKKSRFDTKTIKLDEGAAKEPRPSEDVVSLVLSGQELSPFDRVISNADLAVQSLVKDEKFIIANQIGKLIDFCKSQKVELEKQQQEYRELLPKIEEANDRMTQALNVSLTSERTVQQLQVALENSWKEVDASRAREQSIQEQMSEMYSKLSTLEGKVQKNQKSDTMGELGDVGPLASKKETILRERDRLQAEVEELDKRLHMQRLYSENIEKRRQDAESANAALMQELESSDTNKIKFKRRIQDLYMNLEKAKEENIAMTKKNFSLENRIDELQKQIELKAVESQMMRAQFDKLKFDQASWNKTLLQRSTALNTCTQDNRSLAEQLRTVLNRLKAKEYEVLEIKQDCKKSIANYDLLTTKLNKLSNARTTLAKDISVFKNEITNLHKECNLNLKTINAERHEKEQIIHERDGLRSQIAKLINNKRDLEHSIMLKNSTIERLQDDIMKKSLKMDEIKQSFDQVIKERDQNGQEIEVLNNKLDDLQENVSLKTDQIVDLKKALVEKQAIFIKTKQNLESTNSDRLILRQQLQACMEEKDNCRTHLTHVSYQISQLKEEITNAQNKVLSLALENEKLTKEKQELKMEVRNKTTLLNSVRNELKDTKRENDRLYKSLSVDERRLMKQAIKLDNTMHEKDIIGSQMIRRNDEIVLLKEQISILEIALQRGQMQYNHRIEDIKLLKLEVMRLRSQRNLLTRGLANTANTRQEVLQLHRLLLQERITTAALKEEAISPLNIHRWRPLAGRDPDRMELIQKVIALQKRLLKMQVQASNREQELHHSHKLYMLLKEYIAKLPSYKVKEELLQSQKVIRTRSRKLKALIAELNIKEVEIKARDCALEDIKSTLTTTQKEVNQLKKKSINEHAPTILPERVLPGTRTLGAGFKVGCQ